MACKYYYKDIEFDSLESFESYMEDNSVVLDSNFDINQILSIDDRFIVSVRRDFGTTDLYKRAFHYFSIHMDSFMNPLEDVFVGEDGAVENVPLNRNEAIAETYQELLSDVEEYETRVRTGETLTDEESKDFEALKRLQDVKVFNNVVKDYYPSITWKKHPKTGEYVYGESPDLTNAYISEDDFTINFVEDEIDQNDPKKDTRENWHEEQDSINPLKKASQAVKDLMMNVFIEHTDGSFERVTPGFVFYKLLQTLPGIDTTGSQDPLNEELKQLKDNFKNAGMKEGVLSNREYQIYKKIETLITAAHRTRDNEGKLLPSNIVLRWVGDNQKGWYEITNTVTATRVSYKNLKNNTPAIYRDMMNRFNLPISTVNILYQKAETGTTLNSIYHVLNSMRIKNPYFANYKWEYRHGKPQLTRSYRPFKDQSNLKSVQNMIVTTLGANYKILEKHIKSIQNAQKTKDPKFNKAKLIKEILTDVGIPGNIIISAGSENKILNVLEALHVASQNIGKQNGEDEDGNPVFLTLNDVLEDQKGNLISIAKEVAKSSQEIGRSTSYQGAERKPKWFYVNSNQVSDTYNQIINKKITREFLETDFYKNNPFNPFRSQEASNINEVFSVMEHEEIADEKQTMYSSKPVSYKKEDAQHWVDRNFMYGFMDMVSFSATNPQYIQQFYTISDKPTILGTQINVLSPEKLHQSVALAIKQELRRPDHKGLKNYNRNKQFLDYPYDAYKLKTEEDIAELATKILEKWKLDAEIFLDNYLQTNPNLATGLDNANQALIANGLIADSVIPSVKDSPLSYRKGTLKTQEEHDITKAILLPAFTLWYQNYFINSLFLNQLAAGDQAQYKDAYDQIKRMSMIFAQGYKGRVNDETGLRERYNTVVGRDVTDEKLPNHNFWKKFNLLLNKRYDITDAQGFVTPERANNVRKGFSREANLGSAFKPIYSGIDNKGIVRGVKYSTIELTDELVRIFEPLKELRFQMTFSRGNFSPEELTEIRELYDKKIDNPKEFSISDEIAYGGYVQRTIDENTHIDEFVFASAFKFGAPTNVAELNENGTFDLGTAEEGPEVVELLNTNYRHQLNPRHDADAKTANMTQLTYQLNTNGLNFAQLKRVLTLNALIHEMGIEESVDRLTNEGKIDLTARAKIRHELNKMTENVVGTERLNDFLNQPGISLNLPFITNKIQQYLLSSVSKKTVEIKHKGAKLVLQSAIGTGQEEPKVVFTKNGKPLPEDSNEEPDSYYMEAYVPESLYKSLKEQGLTDEQILNEPVYSNILGFRIPSTELHSAVPLRIKGWYPNKYGDNNIIVPKELVLLHGSDFDIDSLYIVSPYVAKETFKIEDAVISEKGVAVGYVKGTDGKLKPNVPKGFETYTEFVRSVYDQNKDNTTLQKKLIKYVKEGASNEILSTFMETITAGRNLRYMMTPIDLSPFNDMKDDSSVFSYMADLTKLKYPDRQEAPIQEEGESVEDFRDRKEKWRESMLRFPRNLNRPDHELEMHQDNFRAKALTGNFANAFKIISYIFMGTNKFDTNKPITQKDQPLPKLKEEYHIELLGKKYDGFVRDVSDGSGRTIWENLDSLINAAIDHVKEQILNIVNATEQTSNVWVSMISMGIPLKDVSLFMTQPSILEISNRASDRNALNTIKGDIKSRIIAQVLEDSHQRSLFAEQVDVLENTDPSSYTYKKTVDDVLDILTLEPIELNRRNLEVGFTKIYNNFSEFTIEDLLVQLQVLDTFTTMDRLGTEYILKGSLALKSVQQIPGDFVGIQNLLEYYDVYFDTVSFLEGKEIELPEDLPFENVNLSNIPNVQSSLKVLDWSRDFIGNVIVKNSPSAVTFSKYIESYATASSGKDVTDEESDAERGVLARNPNESIQNIRNQFVEYLLSGVTYEDNGVVYTMNTANYPDVEVKERDFTRTLRGSAAWVYDFLHNGITINGRKMKSFYEIWYEYGRTGKNKFLQQITIHKNRADGTYSLRFNLGSSLDPGEKRVYEDSFDVLKEIPIFEGQTEPDYYPDNSFNEFQHMLLKFATIDQGLAFGSMNYSAIMNPAIFVPLSKEIDKYLFSFFIGLKENNYEPINDVYNLTDHFMIQFAMQNKDNLYNFYNNSSVVKDEGGKKPLIGKDIHETNTIYFDLKIEGNHKDKLPIFAKYGSGAYVKVYESEIATYYQLIGRKSSNRVFQFNPELINSEYTIKNYFKPEILGISGKFRGNQLLVPSSNPKTKIIEVGDIIGTHPSGDIARTDMRMYHINNISHEMINEVEHVVIDLGSTDGSPIFTTNSPESTTKIPNCIL